MKINTRIVLCSATLAALLLPAAAQINQRKENQQDRIANGVAERRTHRRRDRQS